MNLESLLSGVEEKLFGTIGDEEEADYEQHRIINMGGNSIFQ